MVNYMREIAKMLDVKFDENFECNDDYGHTYRITDKGLLLNGVPASETLSMLLDGTLTVKRKPWKPSMYDTYYYTDGHHVYCEEWMNYICDWNCYKLGNCYETQKEAENNAEKWSKFYSSDNILKFYTT